MTATGETIEKESMIDQVMALIGCKKFFISMLCFEKCHTASINKSWWKVVRSGRELQKLG